MSRIRCQRKGCNNPATVPLTVSFGPDLTKKIFVCDVHAAEIREVARKWKIRIIKNQ